MSTRYARVNIPDGKKSADYAETIRRYLPSNYRVSAYLISSPNAIQIEGEDNAGWTMDGYVLPRLASGLHFGRECDAWGREI